MSIKPAILHTEEHPDVDDLITEDETPVDNLFSEKQMRLLTEPLYTSWADPPDGRPFLAMANVGLFYATSKPPVVPDVLLSLNVVCPRNLWPKTNRSYFVWEYGKVPDAIIEIVSNKEGGEDSTKFRMYESLRIPYYIIYDPQAQLSDEVLRGYELHQTRYRRMQSPLWFPGIELGLELWQGEFEAHEDQWIRWRDSRSRIIPTGAEMAASEAERARQEAERARREAERANHESERADHEAERANHESERAARLEAKLRELGVDPDA